MADARRALLLTHAEQLRSIQRAREAIEGCGSSSAGCEVATADLENLLGDFVFDVARREIDRYTSALELHRDYSERFLDLFGDCLPGGIDAGPPLLLKGALDSEQIGHLTVENHTRRDVDVAFGLSEFYSGEDGGPVALPAEFTSGSSLPSLPDRQVPAKGKRTFDLKLGLKNVKKGVEYCAILTVIAGGRIRKKLGVKLVVEP